MKYRVALMVSPMGHDVNRMSAITKQWLEEVGIFEVAVAGDCDLATRSIDAYMADESALDNTDLFIFICPHDQWSEASRRELERRVAAGTPVLFEHGLHPAFRDWPEAEKMIGLLWRDTGFHADFGYCDVKMQKQHPITEGVADFRTKEELFCGLTNVWNVPLEVLVTGYSDETLISRHGETGTGHDEPVLTLGRYGKGMTLDFILGHVWPFYTGHGLQENTMIAYEPPQVKTLLMRACEWAVREKIEFTADI